MNKVFVLVLLASSAACSGATSTIERGARGPGGTDPTSGSETNGDPGASPAAAEGEMTYSGVYEVPVPPELAAAATYPPDEVHWTVAGGTARLAYNLPKGLVGTSLRVDFTGPFDPVTNKGTLTGPAGTSECTATATTVVCHEVMRGLLPIDADMALIESIAKVEYAGPAEHRLEVARRFIGDPIGIIHIDLSTGTAEPAHGPEHETEEED